MEDRENLPTNPKEQLKEFLGDAVAGDVRFQAMNDYVEKTYASDDEGRLFAIQSVVVEKRGTMPGYRSAFKQLSEISSKIAGDGLSDRIVRAEMMEAVLDEVDEKWVKENSK